MLTLNYSLYDCFAEQCFTGHTAAVVEVLQKPEHKFARKISVELCQSITCFVWREDDQIWVESITKDGDVWSINHGLLAVAKQFVSKKGTLYSVDSVFEVEILNNLVSISVPKYELGSMEMPERLNQAFDVIPVSVREMEKACLIELRTAEEVVDLKVNFNRMSKLDYDRVVVTAESATTSFDYVYRYFSAKSDVSENRASLYVQTFLPLFWRDRLNKDSFSFFQPSERQSTGKATIKENCVVVEASVKKTFDGILKVL